MHSLILTFLLHAVAVLALGSSSLARAENDLAPGTLRAASFNPVTFLRQAIAAFKPTTLAESARNAASSPLSVDFESGAEDDRVSLLLAESQLRVRLGKELQLHCEVSSRDEFEPELGLDLALQFKFK